MSDATISNFNEEKAKLAAKKAAKAARRAAVSGSWQEQLRVSTRDGVTPLSSPNNLLLMLQNEPQLAGRFSFNEMSAEVLCDGAPADDSTTFDVRTTLERCYNFTPNETETMRAIYRVAMERRTHPVREYLRGLAWDGTTRLQAVASEILQADADGDAPTERLYRIMVRKWFISAVARALSPGCKVDTALILVGEQESYKSTFFRKLASPWFSDTGMNIDDKDAFQQLARSWIYEWSELENVTGKSAVSKVKAFLSSAEDNFRVPYGRSSRIVPRSSVIVGSTNKDTFLHDPTGSRRFWCVRVAAKIDTARVEAERDQLWAEAVAAYDAGEIWWLTSDEEALRGKLSEQFTEEEAWAQEVLKWLEGRTKVTVNSVLAGALGISSREREKKHQMDVANILRKAGFVRGKNAETFEGERTICWTLPSKPAPEEVPDEYLNADSAGHGYENDEGYYPTDRSFV